MEPRENEWDLVIKVKHGDTLRRFGAYVHGWSMDHNMSKLRAKIVSLFKFSPDADLILTYIDEDGDVVTLDGDDELLDAAISQHLNPLRINVQLKTCGSSDSKSQTASPTPTGSHQIETRPPQISYAVDEALKSFPEPFRGALSKLSQDLALKATSSAPALAEFADYFKFGLSNISLPSQSPVGETSGTSNGASTYLMDLSVSDEPKTSTDPIPVTIVSATTNSSNPVPEPFPKQNESVSMTQGPGVTVPTVDLNLDPPRNPHAEFPSINDLLSCTWTTNYNVELEKQGGGTRDGKSDIAPATLPAPATGQRVDHNSRNFAASNPFVPPNRISQLLGDDSIKQFPISAASTSQLHNSQVDVHYKTNMGVPTTPEVPLPRVSFPANPYRRTHSYHDSILRTFHKGVRCDGCGMFPIMGPRFKSNVKEDYDLCSFCFSEMGNEADYTRIERSPYQSPRMFKHSRYGVSSSRPFHGCGIRQSRAKSGSLLRAKLESCFIKDVTVADGTVMPPCTPFTKIWRMRNNGTVVWSVGTQLVWTGGNRFANQVSTVLEIPVNGCSVGEEIDIAVDFTSPSRPGSYISYWRMASPSGHKFGQRVWVQIQVANPPPNSAAGSFHGDINLNLPPESSGRNGLGIIDGNTESLDGACSKPNFTDAAPESLVNVVPSTSMEPATADGLLGAIDGRAQLTPEVVPPVSYPVIDFPESSFDGTTRAQLTPEVVPPVSYPVIDFPESSSHGTMRAQLTPEVVPPVSYPVIDLPEASSNGATVADATDDNPVEQTLLEELKEMGFKQIDLNKEVLRLNEYNLEQSVEDLCGYAEWAPLLNELKEMGFHDKELNKKMLVKNGGSITHVVLDLIAGEKDE